MEIPQSKKSLVLETLSPLAGEKELVSLCFHFPHSNSSLENPPPGYIKMPFRDDKSRHGIVTLLPAIDIGKNTKSASAFSDSGGWQVGIEFSDSVRPEVGALTRSNTGNQMAIVLNNEILSMPVIREPFSEGCAIAGNFSEGEAKQLAAAFLLPRSPRFELVQ